MGPAKITEEIFDVVTKIPKIVKNLTGVDIAHVSCFLLTNQVSFKNLSTNKGGVLIKLIREYIKSILELYLNLSIMSIIEILLVNLGIDPTKCLIIHHVIHLSSVNEIIFLFSGYKISSLS